MGSRFRNKQLIGFDFSHLSFVLVCYALASCLFLLTGGVLEQCLILYIVKILAKSLSFTPNCLFFAYSTTKLSTLP